MSLAPIILFVYNRPQHTLRTLEALTKNYLAKETELYVFADGPKDIYDLENIEKIKNTRDIVKSKAWCKKTILIERERNYGLANSIIEGVSDVLSNFEKVIVLEDDLVVSPYFLQYMNDALNIYKLNNDVACISGYTYPVKGNLPEIFFIKGADCWGWATWKRAWHFFEKDGNKLLDELKEKSLEREFDFNNTYPYLQMLKDQIAGKNNSWAIRWYASTFLKNKYCLYPGLSLVQNIGFDGSGTHSNNSDTWKVDVADRQILVSEISVQENKESKKMVIEYFKSLLPSRISILKAFIKKLLFRKN